MTKERILTRPHSVSSELQRADYQRQKEKLKRLVETGRLVEGRKKCIHCNREQNLSEFYLHPQMKDGRLNKCKTCTKKHVKTRYYENCDERAAYEKWRFTTKHRKAKLLEYQRTSRAQNPQKWRARNALGNAVRDGRVVRKPCCVCGDPKSQGHHHDYSKPLDVIWYCFRHHRELGHGQTVRH